MGSRAIHPGEHLAEELEVLHMSAAELARQLDVPTNRVTAILNGKATKKLPTLNAPDQVHAWLDALASPTATVADADHRADPLYLSCT